MSYKVVMIRKYNVNHFLLKDSKINQDVIENILKKYTGFEGDDIFYFEEEKITSKMDDFIDECKKEITNEDKSQYLLLYLGTSSEIPPIVKREAKKVGYEYGIKIEENSTYSSIFHEVIFGHFDELIAFKDKLNENLLFPTYEMAEEYANVHHKLDEEGKGVEWELYMEIFEIWKFEI